MGDGTGALSPIKEDVVRTRSNGNNSDGNKSSATSGLPQQAVIVCGSDQARDAAAACASVASAENPDTGLAP